MKLNLKKVESEMKRLKWNKTRLAKEMGITRQALRFYFDIQPTTIKRVEKFAKALNLSDKDLLI